MSLLRFTLVGEGSTDRALLPVLDWMLRAHIQRPLQPQWPEYFPYERPASLADRIDLALQLYPCELLFVHRDADRYSRTDRVEEIRQAITQSDSARNLPAICVVPVRMTETWLLIDEEALRQAAGNPLGHIILNMPRPRDLEGFSDPKTLLRNLIRDASELSGRRLARLDTSASVIRLAQLIGDFSTLRQLEAFRAMEAEFLQLKDKQGW